MLISKKDKKIVRDLAKKYRDYCGSQRNLKNKKIWEEHNSLKSDRPIVMTCPYWHTFKEVEPAFPKLQTETQQGWEKIFVSKIWQYENIIDDTCFDPWIVMDAKRRMPKVGIWGYNLKVEEDKKSGGKRFYGEQIHSMDDFDRMEATPHEVIDRNPKEVQIARDLFGDILPIHVKCSTIYPKWGGYDLSEAVGKLLGGEEMMLKLYTAPDLVHKLMAFMRDAVLANLEQGEKAGDWSTVDSDSYVVNHTDDLPKIKPNTYGAKLSDIWGFSHAQEFEGVSPAQHKEFLLNYQMPILKKYGLVSYGCCETLDRKIDMLREIPNLRRICLGPMSDVAYCAEQIGKDYIMSWRPNPALVGMGYTIDKCRKAVRDGIKASKGGYIEIMLKEMMTIENDPQRVIDFTNMAMVEALS